MLSARIYGVVGGAALFMASAVSGSAYAQDPWRWSLTPYLWGSGIDGTVRAFGQEAEVDASFSDVAEFVDSGFAIVVEAERDQHRAWVDIFTVSLKESGNLDEAGPGISVKVDNNIVEAGYAWSPQPAGHVDWYAGLRYMDVENKFSVTGLGAIKDGEDWIDPFVGLRVLMPLGGNWGASLRGDVGGFGVGSDLAWLVGATLGYQFNDTVTGLVGYRLLDTDFEDGAFKYDVTQSGLGAALRFNL